MNSFVLDQKRIHLNVKMKTQMKLKGICKSQVKNIKFEEYYN